MSFKITCNKCGKEAAFTTERRNFHFTSEVEIHLEETITIGNDDNGIYLVQCNNPLCENRIEATEEPHKNAGMSTEDAGRVVAQTLDKQLIDFIEGLEGKKNAKS